QPAERLIASGLRDLCAAFSADLLEALFQQTRVRCFALADRAQPTAQAGHLAALEPGAQRLGAERFRRAIAIEQGQEHLAFARVGPAIVAEDLALAVAEDVLHLLGKQLIADEPFAVGL